MDIFKFLASVAVLVEYTPQQLKEFGYDIYGITAISLSIFFVRTLIEVVAIRLGIDLAKVAVRIIKAIIQYVRGLIYSIRLRLGYQPNSNLVVKSSNPKWWFRLMNSFWVNGNHTRNKIISFFQVADDVGILACNAIPFMPTSIPAFLYNLRQHKLPWWRFNNRSFAALIVGGIIRMMIFIGLTILN